jgi:ceramide glucosyltransferase
MTSAEAIGATGALLSLAYFWIAHRCFAQWARERPTHSAPPAEDAITFLRPLKCGVPALAAKLEIMARAMRTGDQLILGADTGSAEEMLSEEVRAAFPGRDIVVVPCVAGAAPNPKVSKLLQMTPHARHERCIFADSEALLDPEFLARWRAEWIASGADVLTAGYRIDGARTWPQRLDAAALLVTLWPGLAVLRAAGPLRVMLGACFALRRADLEAVGGWAAFGEELAEDNRLGEALAATGRSIRLSTEVVTLESDSLSWGDWWRHQRRVAVTYRAANPWGYAGSIVTHGESWALAMVFAGHAWGLALFFAVWAGRTALAARMASRIGFDLRGLPLAVLGASLAGTVCWVANWGARAVWWGGRRRRVHFRGRLAGI